MKLYPDIIITGIMAPLAVALLISVIKFTYHTLNATMASNAKNKFTTWLVIRYILAALLTAAIFIFMSFGKLFAMLLFVVLLSISVFIAHDYFSLTMFNVMDETKGKTFDELSDMLGNCQPTEKERIKKIKAVMRKMI